MYITRLASNEIFSPSNKIHREVGRAKDLSAPRYTLKAHGEVVYGLLASCSGLLTPAKGSTLVTGVPSS